FTAQESSTMQLTYRGQAYDLSSPAVEATPSGETATFLGKSYTRMRFNVAQRNQPAELTYRGVRYAR
ncbi:MAG: DUF4278 domain-containing protein, partial [Cyanobacteria bacterium J06638_6]